MMYKRGVAGPLFGWICMLYSSMSYVVHMSHSSSLSFQLTVGILVDNLGLPGFWNFFASDLSFVPHPEDICIGSHHVMNIKQANNGAIVSCKQNGLQSHLDVYRL